MPIFFFQKLPWLISFIGRDYPQILKRHAQIYCLHHNHIQQRHGLLAFIFFTRPNMPPSTFCQHQQKKESKRIFLYIHKHIQHLLISNEKKSRQ